MARILVIDDDSEYLEMINLLLQRAGHQVALSAEGEEGLAMALAETPDLVILDVMMPGVTGYEICRRLRSEPETACVPIIILTARGQPVDRDAALEAGADEYLSKPVTMTELVERVEALLADEAAVKAVPFGGVVVLMSLRGGVGTTTLAVNLAASATQTTQGGVCLVDLCPASGHVALQLGLRPEPNWSDLSRVGEFGAVAIDTYLLKHDSGLHVLASPVFPVRGDESLTRPVVRTALSTLQQRYSTVIVDAPPVLDEAAVAALEAATTVGLVITGESASIQTAVGTLRVLKTWFSKFQIVINQVTPGTMPSSEAIERALKRPVGGVVPFDPAQAQALAQARPLVIGDPDAPMAVAVREMTRVLARCEVSG
jgi:pilus assembly protein CpaE